MKRIRRTEMYTKDRNSAGTEGKVAKWRIRQILLYIESHWRSSMSILTICRN